MEAFVFVIGNWGWEGGAIGLFFRKKAVSQPPAESPLGPSFAGGSVGDCVTARFCVCAYISPKIRRVDVVMCRCFRSVGGWSEWATTFFCFDPHCVRVTSRGRAKPVVSEVIRAFVCVQHDLIGELSRASVGNW